MNAKFTPNAAQALNGAADRARALGHDFVGSEHILLALLENPGCSACRRLSALALAPAELAETLKAMMAPAQAPVQIRGNLPVTARTRKILEMAALEAGDGNAVDTVNLVAAMLKEGENAAAQLLFNAGLTVEKFLAAGLQGGESDPAAAESAGAARESAAPKERKTPMLNAYGRDLTAMAAAGKLDPVIGRKTELERVIQILSRRTKNNAVLIGEAGVGKTAVVEGLAEAIHRGEVPERMQDRRVIAVDMARIVAGTQYRGQFEERLKKLVDETRRSGNVILFLDEIHTMVGAGGSEGAMDAANILKPALARGEVQCVGATTLKEYHKSIEKDAALERRFQSVTVEEPSVADTVAILEGIAPRYADHHAVRFSPEALRAAAELTARYLPDRRLPDKAIDAIDETGARLRMGASVRPPELVEKQTQIDGLRRQKDEAVAAGDFDTACRCREAVREASREFSAALAAWRESHAELTLDVDADDIAATVAAMSGVPAERLNASTSRRLLEMEDELSRAVVGQQPAIAAVSRALRRSRAFPGAHRRPIGSFLFLGPTGVGKTHLAKMLAERVFGDEKALIMLDMSEFQEKYSSSRLVGAPPGYVGYDEGGQLTEKVRRRPYSVVLFDEFEKANADVCNMLLQILDDGRLTDGQGRVVDFRNTIVICTANLGAAGGPGRALGFDGGDDGGDGAAERERLLGEAKRTFRPELLNRFDETVVFRRLGREDLQRILALEIDAFAARLRPLGATLAVDDAAVAWMVEQSRRENLGARPLRRAVQRYLEDPLAEAALAGKLKTRLRVRLAPDGSSLKF